MLNKIPSEWDKLLRKADIGNVNRDTQPTQDLVEWFATSGVEGDDKEEREKKRKAKIKQSGEENMTVVNTQNMCQD